MRILSLASALRPTPIKGLFVVPANIDLSGAELELASALGRETLLRDAIDLWEKETPGDASVDFLLIDCPPSLGLLCINALSAADEVIIPMQTEFFALQGMSKLMEVVELVKKRINPALSLGGIVACRMDTRTRLSLEVLEDIRAHFPSLLFKTRIRQNVKLAEAPSFGKTVLEYDPDSNGARDYRALAAEFLGEKISDSEVAEIEAEDAHAL